MTPVAETLFHHILEHALERHYLSTAYHQRRAHRDELAHRLWLQLPPPQRQLFESVEKAYDRTQDAELEAMFLATTEQIALLFAPHFPRMAEK